MPFANLIPADAPPTVRPKQLAEWLGVSYSSILLWEKKRILPRALRLGRGTMLFDTAQVRLYIECLIENTREGER